LISIWDGLLLPIRPLVQMAGQDLPSMWARFADVIGKNFPSPYIKHG
jgi:hypothetical protein